MYFKIPFAGPSNLTVNVTEDIDSLSVFIQWDAVINFLNTTYMVTWNNGINPVESAPLTEQTSYTITGLTLDAVYNITVTAANECGTGSEFSTSIVLSADIPPTSSSISSTITSPVTTTDLIATTIAVVNTSSTIVTINSSIPSDTVVVPSVFLSPVANSTTSFTSTSTTSSIAIITTTTFAVTTTITTTADASTTATVDPTKYTPSLTSIDITTTTAATATTATTVDPTTSTPSLTSIYIKTISTTITGAIPSIIATTSQGGVVSLGGITSLPGEIFQTAVATTSIGVSPAPTTENSSSSEVVSESHVCIRSYGTMLRGQRRVHISSYKKQLVCAGLKQNRDYLRRNADLILLHQVPSIELIYGNHCTIQSIKLLLLS